MKKNILIIAFLFLLNISYSINFNFDNTSNFNHTPGVELSTFNSILSCEMLPPSTTQLAASNAGFGNDSDGQPGYDIKQVISAIWVTGATNWEFQFTDDGGNVISYITGNLNNNLNMDNVPELCYGTSYDIVVQAMVGGVWCGFGPVVTIIMEDFPSTKMQNTYCGTTVLTLLTTIECDVIGNVQAYEWRFTTDNGATVFEYLTGPLESIFLDSSPDMRYNKIYNVEVKAKVCDVWGPYGESCFFIVGPIPFTQVDPQYCGGEYAPVVSFQWVPGATEYWAKIYPTDPDNPNLPVLGTPFLHNVTNPAIPSIPISSYPLEPGNAYVIAVKPFIGEQEGDYGLHCLMFYDYVGAPSGGPPNDNYEWSNIQEEKNPSTSSITLFPNPNSGNNFFLNSSIDTEGELKIFNLTGEIVHFEKIEIHQGQNEVSLYKTLDPGMYTLLLSDAIDFHESIKFIVNN